MARGELLTVFLLAFVVIAVLVVTTWKSRAEITRNFRRGKLSQMETGGSGKKRNHVPLTSVVVDTEGAVAVNNFNEQKSTKQH
jgi:FtsZ-interacting cell division protein ZipA